MTLSTGAKVGIAVGAGVGALVFIVGLVLIILKRRQRRKLAAAFGSGIAEMEDQNKNLGAQFVDGEWRNEADVVEPEHELDSKGVPMPPAPPQELDGHEIEIPGSDSTSLSRQ
jgi:hypothetical protein